jgi:hypothetical protein
LTSKYVEEAVRQKLMRLGLIKEVVEQLKNRCSTTSCSSKPAFDLPEELPSAA